MTQPFGARLDAALRERGPLCVGIDPHSQLLTAWNLSDDVAGLAEFAERCVDALAGHVAAVKPQSAFFERFGSRGIAVLETTVQRFRAAGTLVVLDVKRGDIGSTMQAYAQSYLDPAAPLCADAITVNPYLGVGALAPALDLATASGLGVFVLALTSNPEGAAVQQARAGDGGSVAQHVVDELAPRNTGQAPVGSVGVVVGATIGALPIDLSALNGPVLVPGLGAQGGTPADLRRLFGDGRAGLLPSTSRGVLRAGPDPAALRAAARATADEVAAGFA